MRQPFSALCVSVIGYRLSVPPSVVVDQISISPLMTASRRARTLSSAGDPDALTRYRAASPRVAERCMLTVSAAEPAKLCGNKRGGGAAALHVLVIFGADLASAACSVGTCPQWLD